MISAHLEQRVGRVPEHPLHILHPGRRVGVAEFPAEGHMGALHNALPDQEQLLLPGAIPVPGRQGGVHGPIVALRILLHDVVDRIRVCIRDARDQQAVLVLQVGLRADDDALNANRAVDTHLDGDLADVAHPHVCRPREEVGRVVECDLLRGPARPDPVDDRASDSVQFHVATVRAAGGRGEVWFDTCTLLQGRKGADFRVLLR